MSESIESLATFRTGVINNFEALLSMSAELMLNVRHVEFKKAGGKQGIGIVKFTAPDEEYVDTIQKEIYDLVESSDLRHKGFRRCYQTIQFGDSPNENWLPDD